MTSSTLVLDTQRLPGTDEELAGPPRAIAPVRRAERISSIGIDAPCLGASSGRVNLPQTPFSIRRLFAATRVGLMLEALALTTADCEAAPALP
jgi:hypothetical protein